MCTTLNILNKKFIKQDPIKFTENNYGDKKNIIGY